VLGVLGDKLSLDMWARRGDFGGEPTDVGERGASRASPSGELMKLRGRGLDLEAR
jgi:hypothetical protein